MIALSEVGIKKTRLEQAIITSLSGQQTLTAKVSLQFTVFLCAYAFCSCETTPSIEVATLLDFVQFEIPLEYEWILYAPLKYSFYGDGYEWHACDSISECRKNTPFIWNIKHFTSAIVLKFNVSTLVGEFQSEIFLKFIHYNGLPPFLVKIYRRHQQQEHQQQERSNRVSGTRISSDLNSSNRNSSICISSNRISSNGNSSNRISSNRNSSNRISSNRNSSNRISSNRNSSNRNSSNRLSSICISSNRISSNTVA
ncbi:gram positive anchor [Plakobranchus ocellatus]|uniref:Gram positive anchor n=1 Tax=Plakobranchus ocellatus TaxID=259542 RepID=A0AAV4ARH0_9GAST|nr:gram positive anchor [Plakobranchus ocellatus]